MIPYVRLADEDLLRKAIEELCATAGQCYARGWVPATSGNFSVRSGDRVFITASGLDKGRLTPQDLLEIGMDGAVLGGNGRPSAETELHLVIYSERQMLGRFCMCTASGIRCFPANLTRGAICQLRATSF